jgi:hypothetical protein
MKSAWLAASGRGFNEIAKSHKNDILLVRDTDKKFIIYSYIGVPELERPPEKNNGTIKFHIDESVFKGGDVRP